MRAARLAIRCVGGDTIGLDGSGAEMAFLSEFVGPERALVYPLGVEGLPGHADLVGDGLPLFTVTEAGTRELVARLHALDPDFAALDAATIAERFDAAWPTLARAIAEATPLAVPPPPLVYDAHVAPDPGPWLAASDERYDAVVRYHLGGTAPDEELPLSAQAHFTFHVAVENELAKGDIPAMARALERLILQGLTRHEAIHELIAVTCRECARKLDGDEEADEAFVRDLEKLSPHDRRGAELDEVGWISRSARARRRGMN